MSVSHVCYLNLDLKIDEDDCGSVAGSSGKKERHFWQYTVQVSSGSANAQFSVGNPAGNKSDLRIPVP